MNDKGVPWKRQRMIKALGLSGLSQGLSSIFSPIYFSFSFVGNVVLVVFVGLCLFFILLRSGA